MRAGYILKAAWPRAWLIANRGITNEALIERIRQAGQALGLQHSEGVILRGVIAGLIGVMPKNPPFLKP